MRIGYLYLKIQIPGCRSLKEKRSRLRPLLVRAGRELNVAAAEVDYHEIWQTAGIGFVTLSTDSAQTQRSLQAVPAWIEGRWPDLQVEIEIIELI